MKARIRKTGEPLEYTSEEMDDLIANSELKPNINWEQRRYEIAKAIVASIWTHSHIIELNVAKVAIEQADALIAELKKK